MPELSAVGIDLGTTFSALAIVDEQGNGQIVPNVETERLTPSAVYFDDESIIVGQIAKDQAATDPDRAVLFVKRQIGNPSWLFSFDGQRHSATDVSSIILAKLKRDAEQYLNRPLPYAVITVPAYFDDDRRRATIAAGELAGFKVLDIAPITERKMTMTEL
jgi:molecular chaperone DnaK